MRRGNPLPRAFTLVELLVVIGIIAVLVGVLLPVLSAIQSRGRDLACQSNIRQCVQLIHAYAAENKGQLPFGMYWARTSPVDNWLPTGVDPPLISVWTIISSMSSRAYPVTATEYGDPPE